jgi:mannose-6-phosphate isomerase-like protein (cupin superfamily)
MELKISRKWLIVGGIVITVCFLAIIFFLVRGLIFSSTVKNIPASYDANIVTIAQENTNFRKVLFTGLNSQLVVQSIPPGGDIGEETHKYAEQTLFFLSGTGEGELNGKQFPVGPGDVVVVVPGTDHNFWNTGTEDLKIYTVYAPPNHLPDLTEATKAVADANTADEAVGERAPACVK